MNHTVGDIGDIHGDRRACFLLGPEKGTCDVDVRVALGLVACTGFGLTGGWRSSRATTGGCHQPLSGPLRRRLQAGTKHRLFVLELFAGPNVGIS